MKKLTHQESRALKRTMLAVVSFILVAAAMNQAVNAEESSPIEISSQTLKTVVDDSQKVTPRSSDNPLQLGVTPLFGTLQSADRNQLLMNKYSAGLAAEVRLSPNVSLEGIFRYAEYNVRPDLVMMNMASSQVA